MSKSSNDDVGTMGREWLLDSIHGVEEYEAWWDRSPVFKVSPQEMSKQISSNYHHSSKSAQPHTAASATNNAVLQPAHIMISQNHSISSTNTLRIWGNICATLTAQGYDTTKNLINNYTNNNDQLNLNNPIIASKFCGSSEEDQMNAFSELCNILLINPYIKKNSASSSDGDNVDVVLPNNETQKVNMVREMLNKHAAVYDLFFQLAPHIHLLGFFKPIRGPKTIEQNIDRFDPILIVMYVTPPDHIRVSNPAPTLRSPTTENENSDIDDNGCSISEAARSNNIQKSISSAFSSQSSWINSASCHHMSFLKSTAQKSVAPSVLHTCSHLLEPERDVGKMHTTLTITICNMLGIKRCMPISLSGYTTAVKKMSKSNNYQSSMSTTSSSPQTHEPIEFVLWQDSELSMDWFNHCYNNPMVRVINEIPPSSHSSSGRVGVGDGVKKINNKVYQQHGQQRLMEKSFLMDRIEKVSSASASSSVGEEDNISRWDKAVHTYNSLSITEASHDAVVKRLNLRVGDLVHGQKSYPKTYRSLRIVQHNEVHLQLPQSASSTLPPPSVQ